MEKGKNFVIAALVVAVVCMSTGYALLSQTLNINGTANIPDVEWNVEFTAIEKTLTDATENADPTASGTTASFDVELSKPGSKAVYTITVKNNGTLPAKLKSITNLDSINAAAPTEIQYSVSGALVGSTLAAGAETTVTVTVEWPESSTTIPTGVTSKSATIALVYEQA